MRRHGLYATTAPIRAGLDLEMPGPSQWRGKSLAHSLLADRLSTHTLDNCVRRILNMVNEAARSNIPEQTPERPLNREQDRKLLRRAAAESIVLMKNEEKILPLNPRKAIAVIGPNAAIAAYRGGRIAHLRPYYTVSPLEAISQRSDGSVHFSQGIYNHKERPLLGHQLLTSDGKPGFDMYIYTEPPSVEDRVPVDRYEFLNSCGYFLNYENPDHIDGENWHVDISGRLVATESGPYDFGVSVQGTANLYLDGKLVVDNTKDQQFGEGFFRAGTVEKVGTVQLTKGETYHVLVHWAGAHTSDLIKNSPLTFHPGGLRLGGCYQMDASASIRAAAQLAGQVDQVVVLAGLMGDWENEGADRPNIDLPQHTSDLITSVLDANPNTVVCISSGSPVTMPWAGRTKALLHVWYGGNETGHAISDILYGHVNPSGKLPLSFPVDLRDNPTFLCSQAERKRILYAEDVYVGYRFYDTLERPVLFPFGHGLSYTEFRLSDLRLRVDGSQEKAVISVKIKIENLGEYDGAEVVQVYIEPQKPSVGRPVKELKGFEKKNVLKQSSTTAAIEMELKNALGFWDEAEDRWVCEKGNYKVLVGTSSRGNFIQESFRLEETFWWEGL
jgi:beta-glucosidase